MLYKNHLLVSSAIVLPIMETTNTLTPMNLIALGLGALLPDIDEPESYIGRRTRGISDLINLLFGHRGITHTLLFVVAVGILFMWIGELTNNPLIGMYLTLGVFLHILEDSFSAGGVQWLLPITNKTYHITVYSTGSLVEFFIGVVALIIIFMGFKNGIFIFKKDDILTTENMMNLVEIIKAKISYLFLE